VQALITVKELEELDPRWEAEIDFKVSNTMEIMDRGQEAHEHIQAATKIMSKLIKEVRCCSRSDPSDILCSMSLERHLSALLSSNWEWFLLCNDLETRAHSHIAHCL
jgi:hypothetical protein